MKFAPVRIPSEGISLLLARAGSCRRMQHLRELIWIDDNAGNTSWYYVLLHCHGLAGWLELIEIRMYSGFVTGVQVNSIHRCQENDTSLLQISICHRPCKCVSSVLAMFLKFLMIKSPTHCLGRFCNSHLGLGDQSQGVKNDAKGTRSRITN